MIMPTIFGIPEKKLNLLNIASNLRQSANR
jgi:hypothetical protein